MTLDELIARAAGEFNSRRIPFYIIGGLAVSTWTEPRATQDMDVLIQARRRQAPRLKQALLAVGARVTALEIRLLMEGRFVRFKMGGPLLDVRLCASAHDRSALARATEVNYAGVSLRVASPEDLVLFKLQAWRPIDQRDLIVLIRTRRDLDVRYIETWLDPVATESGTAMRQRWRTISQEASSLP